MTTRFLTFSVVAFDSSLYGGHKILRSRGRVHPGECVGCWNGRNGTRLEPVRMRPDAWR